MENIDNAAGTIKTWNNRLPPNTGVVLKSPFNIIASRVSKRSQKAEEKKKSKEAEKKDKKKKQSNEAGEDADDWVWDLEGQTWAEMDLTAPPPDEEWWGSNSGF